ncbi:MAG TPA: NAD-dependent epimerase/dehydratase family protein [Gaiellaceae bacterium]|nr:NAD-dependent epimerase/dehydratase family protein [Gaiellaceae bacterium]
MAERVLITGGAGFIGSHLADELLRAGYSVRALDLLVQQVHGNSGSQRPDYLDAEIELIPGDVRNAEVVRGALESADAVIHLAARVGVGQSMYEQAEYAGANTLGTTVLLDALHEHPVRKLVVASSMSVYGEGAYEPVPAAERTREQLERRDWEPRGAHGEELTPVPTAETKEPALASVYALTKFDQERLCLLYGASYDIPTVALRLFNVYGPRQALSNPYTGALAIFASRLLNDRPPVVYEDGNQRRDFVHVADVARAFLRALEDDGADGRAVNVASGDGVSILELAQALARVLGKDIAPELPGTYRAGDIRHCFADVTLARELLGFEARADRDEALAELAQWLETQPASDHFDRAAAELAERGLTR